jgi:hypothetical protein
MIRKLFLVVLASVLGGSAVTPAHALAPLDLPSSPEGSVNVQIDELVEGNSNSSRYAVNFETGEGSLCPNMPYTSGPCNFQNSKLHFYGSNLLPVCKSARQEHCIDSLAFELAEGNKVVARHLGNAGGSTFPAVPSLGIYAGSQISLWSAAGVPHSGEAETYAVIVRSRQVHNSFSNQYSTTSLDAAVVPYSVETGDYEAPFDFSCREDGKNQVCGGKPAKCVWTDTGVCGLYESFEGSPVVSLQIRMSNEIGGWFRGRLANADIDVEKFSARNSLLTITAKPVTVARFAAQIKKENVSRKGLELLRSNWSPDSEIFGPGSSRGAFATEGWKRKPFNFLDEFRAAANDTAYSVSTLWNFETVDKDTSNSCLADTDRILGIVTTNATVYDGTAPTFRNGTLNYQLSGMHYLPGGTELNLGTYNLVMRSDVARCLYGFSQAPLSATISVLNEQGTKTTATSVVSEKNGWLKLAAYGFTFSKKTIRAKITKAKPTRIACVSVSDETKVRNIRAINPKCPKGFRQK